MNTHYLYLYIKSIRSFLQGNKIDSVNGEYITA